ncbi:hypothetical protein NPIL_615061 [Nephila pilipes]|uniref:Uncharacterized protein n=1 Tax=Nephila pilipes TaxID=299642 RepID=A0A8X6QAG6_NEPPI|nr:hypothetical protein NPIL_615061 [Nephila pilipes]
MQTIFPENIPLCCHGSDACKLPVLCLFPKVLIRKLLLISQTGGVTTDPVPGFSPKPTRHGLGSSPHPKRKQLGPSHGSGLRLGPSLVAKTLKS